MMWNDNGHWGSGDWATIALVVIAGIAVIVAIVFLVRYLSRTGDASSTSSTAAVPPAPASGLEAPKDILKRRYAAGEIDREEYLQRLGDL
jgi:putative membrane protein